MACYEITYTNKQGLHCMVVVEAPNAYIAKSWFAQYKQNHLSKIIYVGEIYGDLWQYQKKGVPFLEAKEEEIVSE